MSTVKTGVQSIGRFLSAMVMPNIGAFIAWGLITALFIPTGWLPNATLAELVGPMIKYLLPLLIGYTGGKVVAGDRGAVMGAITTMGVIVGAEIPMFLGAMIAGPIGGYIIKKFDQMIHGKVKAGFEMLVNNFSIGILGMLSALLAFLVIGPVVEHITTILGAGVGKIVEMQLLPLVSIIVEPAKILFLNNAINHGVFTPLGAEQAAATGKSIFYMIETNPGPGLGILLAYMLMGKGMAKLSASGASIIHFFGGIHEIYFPYVLMKPLLLLAVIGGGMSGVAFNMIMDNGLSGPPSPGSVFALTLMSTKGDGIMLTLASIAIATTVSFVIAAIILKFDKSEEVDLADAQAQISESKEKSKGLNTSDNASENSDTMLSSNTTLSIDTIRKIVVACDAGMGSSAMGATVLRGKVKEAGLDIEVINQAINDLTNADLVITQEELTARAQNQLPSAKHMSISNFMDGGFYDNIVAELKASTKSTSSESSSESSIPAPVATESSTDSNSKANDNTHTENAQGISVNPQDVFIQQKMTSKEDVLKFVAEKMLANGYVSEDYTQALLNREEQVSTFLDNGVAIPHGVTDAKHLVTETGVIVVQLPQGVNWGNDDMVNLVVGIAAAGNEHMEILANLANIIMDDMTANKMGTTATADELINTLSGKGSDSAKKDNNIFENQAVIRVTDQQGMHARPAGKLAQMAKSFADTEVRLTAHGKTVNAKSMAKILSLGLQYNDEVTVSAKGVAEQDAVDDIAMAIIDGIDSVDA